MQMTESKSLKVLVVDDDPFQCSTVTKVLNAMGISEGKSETDARAGVELLDSEWDLLLLDLNMPGMDGI